MGEHDMRTTYPCPTCFHKNKPPIVLLLHILQHFNAFLMSITFLRITAHSTKDCGFAKTLKGGTGTCSPLTPLAARRLQIKQVFPYLKIVLVAWLIVFRCLHRAIHMNLSWWGARCRTNCSFLHRYTCLSFAIIWSFQRIHSVLCLYQQG